MSGTYKYVRVFFKGAVGATANNYVALEVTDATLTLSSSLVPQLSLGARQDNYYVNATITNTTTGDFFTIKGPLAVGESVVIDTELETVTTSDGSKMIVAFSSRRAGWLDLQPGNNTLKYTEAGVSALTFYTEFYPSAVV